MELEAFQREEKIEEYEAFKKIVAVFMQQISNLDTLPVLRYSRQLGDMVYRERDCEMPVSSLSAGYQSLLWMVMNLAHRLALLNPNHADTLQKTEGIVLIDEIDMHLHPKWQWNVVSALESMFPNIQFIMATHSPIVISSCKNSTLIQVDENQSIRYLENAYGYSVKDVLELRQGSGEKPRKIERLIDQFEKAVNREDYTAAKKVIEMMRSELGEDHAEVQNAEGELEMINWIAEN